MTVRELKEMAERRASHGALQHPLSDIPPANPVRFADPPSVVGTAGPQLAPEEPAPAAAPAADPDVEAFADWVEVSDVSPCNCSGACGLLDAGAEIDAPVPPVAAAADPLDPPPGVEGNDDAGTLSGSDATVLPLPLVACPPICIPVWAYAAGRPRTALPKIAPPKTTLANMRTRRMALSRLEMLLQAGMRYRLRRQRLSRGTGQ